MVGAPVGYPSGVRIVLVVVLWGAIAHAHGASGAHESPRWCGGKLAVLADGGVWIDGALVAVAETQGLPAAARRTLQLYRSL